MVRVPQVTLAAIPEVVLTSGDPHMSGLRVRPTATAY